jgi:hypothetical protein
MRLHEKLATAEAAHAEKVATLASVRERIGAAQAAVDEANEAHRRLIADAARGAEIAPKAMSSADANVAAAEAALRFWAGAEAGAIAAAEAAAVPVLNAQRELQEIRFGHACATRIAAAEKLEKLAGEYGAAYAAWIATADEIFATWPTGRAPAPHQIEALRELRPGAWCLPRSVQQVIAAAGSPVAVHLLARERDAWGADAAKAISVADRGEAA